MDVSWLSPATASVLAQAVLVLHLAFVGWVVAGGLAAWVRPALAIVHLPAVAWGVWIEASGGVCPLTPLENALLRRAGEAGYEGGFIEYHLLALLYPQGLTRELQVVLAVALLGLNLVVYGLLGRRLLARRRARAPCTLT
jgi:hypothetical protein